MKLQDFHYFIHEKDSRAPWLIFIHGLLGNAGNWRSVTPSFEAQYRILTYDQRGHGHSVKPDSGYAPKDYASDLLVIMDSLKIERASILGHSMGGRTVLQFAAENPNRVTKLIIEDIGPEPTDEYGKELIQTLQSIPVPFKNKLEAKKYLLNELGDARLGHFFYTNLKAQTDESMTWNFNLEKIIETIEEGRRVDGVWDQIRNLKCPTLWIRGENSGALPKHQFDKILKLNPKIKGVEIAEAGHWIHIDQNEEFIRVVGDFLKEPTTL
jgi:esterase